MAVRKKSRWVLRAGAYLLLAACSQPMLETYGCACASRTYTKEEIDGYRAGATRDDPAALAQMEEYYSVWRASNHPQGSAAERREKAIGAVFRQKALAVHEPGIVGEEVARLLMDASDHHLAPEQQLSLLQQAQVQLPYLRDPYLVWPDLKDPKRREMPTKDYIAREIATLQRK